MWCVSENGAGEPDAGARADAGPRAGGLAEQTDSERAGTSGTEEPDVQPARGLREAARREADPRHGDQRLQEDAGGRGAEVRGGETLQSGQLCFWETLAYTN